MKLTKIFKTLFTLILIASAFFIFKGDTLAACGDAAFCDAAPGECSTTSNGGQTIVIGSFQTVTRECSELQNCDYCTSQDLQDNPYCQPVCTTVTECQDSEGNDLPSDTVVTTTCTDTIWETCCTPGTPAGTCGDNICEGTETCSSCESDCGACLVQWCGDGSCNAGETCDSCAADCGSCNFCGNNSCDGGEDCNNCAADCGACAGGSCGDGSCNNGEWCGDCPGDCGTCTSCGDGSCNGGETCGTCSTDCGACVSCGDGSCNGSENCGTCATDCGSCADPSFCGDTTCDAFETCDTCESDCGACAENAAWFQISAGHVGSANAGDASVAIQSDITDTADCVAPACVRSLSRTDLNNTALTDGFAVVGSGTIDANGGISERDQNTYSSNTTKSRYQENYEFFYRNSGLAANPTGDFTGSETDAQKPTYNANDIVYFQSGDLTIQSPWSVASGETYVVFVDGNLTLTDGDGASDQLIDVADGGFLAFIVSGNIIVNEQLGNSTLASTTSNVEGVYIADGTLTIESRGTAGGGDDRFVGEGVFVGWTGVNLNRDFSDGSTRSLENNDKAVELFVYRPDLLVNMPDIMLVPIRIWQETN
ncbi:MAG: hypothetical protein OEX81_00240 [Candidatus Pacebacteria bacterium]|nr:hypothetical protein [Candidatus Paceibacterota bacterium]